ncbi:hypothetical protein BSM4216_1618 [Bacillus smithii]|nr:hypothetical protein BSM4216_1618 [Bacillus smithii]
MTSKDSFYKSMLHNRNENSSKGDETKDKFESLFTTNRKIMDVCMKK